MRKELIIALSCFALGANAQLSHDTTKYPWMDTSKSFHERAKILVSNLTLEEKVDQLGNLVAAPIERDGVTIVPAYQYWNEANHGVIDDGHATSFPCLKAMSSTWDLDLVQRCAKATSDEARYHHINTGKGLDYWCPTINMARDPRWGRDEENYGEDTYLAGRLAVNFLKGLQETPDANGYYKLIGCAKHFAANNYENGRHSTTSFMSEKNLREYYLPVFEQCVKEGNVHSVMAAYNAISTNTSDVNPQGEGISNSKGGLPCSGNKMLLTDILRTEWGFKGYVTSDCAAVSDVYRTSKHLFWGADFVGTKADSLRIEALSASLCLKAGLDINCEFKNTTSVLQRAGEMAVSDAFKAGETKFRQYCNLTEADIDTAVVRLMESRFALGEFDELAGDNISWNNTGYTSEDADKQALALEAAQKTITLLQNNTPEGATAPILPITTDKKVALVGQFVNTLNTGGYSGNSTPTYFSTPYTAFCEKLNYTPANNGATIKASTFTSKSTGANGIDTAYPEELANTAPGNWFCYKDVDFGDGCPKFEMLCSSKDTGLATVNFILDSSDGTPFLSVDNVDTGNWHKMTTVTADITESNRPSGKHDLYVKFSGSNKYAGNYESFRFYDPDYNPMTDGDHPLYMVETTSYVGDNATDEVIAQAVKVAQKADVVFFCGGLQNGGSPIKNDPRDAQSGRESVDRTQMTMPGNQLDVLKAMYAVNKNIVLCWYGGSPMDFTWEKANLPGILACWYNGQAQGQAICDVAYGTVNPSGHLTQTWYNSINDLPQSTDTPTIGKNNSGGMMYYDLDRWGYTYMFYGNGDKNTHQAEKPQYPFGYGLSYTTFGYSDFAAPTSIAANGTGTFTANIKNTGSVDGATVVQLYANFNGNSNYGYNGNMRHKLVGFARVDIKAGETANVSIPVDWKNLSYFNETAHNYQVAGGTVTFELAANSEDIKATANVTVAQGVSEETYLSKPQQFIKDLDIPSVELNSKGYATYSSPYMINVATAGVKAYKAAIDDSQNTITLTELKGYIPSATGILLFGGDNMANQNVEFTAAESGNAANTASNELVPTTTMTKDLIDRPSTTVWALSDTNEFMQLASDVYSLTPNRACLVHTISGTAKAYTMVFADPTGISEVSSSKVQVSGDSKYLKNGQFIIVKNGKQYNAAGQLIK